MTKLAAVVLILALPALVTADINRLKLSPDLEKPDALAWIARRPEPGLTAMLPLLPVWEGGGAPVAADRESPIACPGAAPEHVARYLSQPDCRTHVNAPALWLHAPRTDEQKTVAKEPAPEQVQIQDKHPAN